MTISTPDRLHCLEEEHWALIEDSFPRAKNNKGFQPEISNRQVLEAVIYRARAGCPWRDLPKEYGYWHAIYMRWTRWIKGGVLEKALGKLNAHKEAAGEISAALVLVDSTIVRAHQHAAGAQKKAGPQAIGRSRGGLSTKIHAAAIDERHALSIVLTEGQAGDAPTGEDIVAQLVQMEKVEAMSADKAYDSNAIREALAKAGKEVVIPPRSNRISPAEYDKIKYKERNRIERFFNRLKQFRAAATRYDKLDVMFLGTVTVAMLVISLK